MTRLRTAALQRADERLARCDQCGTWKLTAATDCTTCELYALLDPVMTEQQVLDEIARLRLAQ